jgi:hypothetical protein
MRKLLNVIELHKARKKHSQQQDVVVVVATRHPYRIERFRLRPGPCVCGTWQMQL